MTNLTEWRDEASVGRRGKGSPSRWVHMIGRKAKSGIGGFTFIEVLIAISLIAVLAGIVIVAVNPAKQFINARNVQRKETVETLSSAIFQYMIDNEGNSPPGVDSVLRMIGTDTSGCDISCGRRIATFESGSSEYAEDIKNFLIGSVSEADAAPSSGWVYPDGYQDPGSQWTNEPLAYDGNTGTYAQNTYGYSGWGQFIVLTLSSPIISDRIKLNADYLDSDIAAVDVDVLKDGVWTDIFDGGDENTWNCQWVELPFSKGSVEAARFRYNYKVSGYWYWLYEFQFYQTVEEVFPPVCSSRDATAIQESSAVLHGYVEDDGGEVCQYRFEYGPTASYGSITEWTGSKSSGEIFDEFISGLSTESTYHFKAELRNSAGTAECSDMSFTTQPAGVGWVFPSGSSDPSGDWQNESYAYDDNISTYARDYHAINDPQQWSEFLYFDYPSTPADKLRFYARDGSEVSSVDVDIMENGSWSDVYEGSFEDKQWVEKTFSEGVITQVRIRFYTPNIGNGFFWELYEFGLQKTSEISSSACIDLSAYLVPDYLVAVPFDPKNGSSGKTYYAVQKSVDGKINIYACSDD